MVLKIFGNIPRFWSLFHRTKITVGPYFFRKFHVTYMKNCSHVKNGIKYKISGKNQKISGKNKKNSEKFGKIRKNSEKFRHFREKSNKNANFF